MKDFSKILKETRRETIKQLAIHEQSGTLDDYIKEFAPDYFVKGQAMIFTLANDLDDYYRR